MFISEITAPGRLLLKKREAINQRLFISKGPGARFERAPENFEPFEK